VLALANSIGGFNGERIWENWGMSNDEEQVTQLVDKLIN